jgi:hypothetical protein
MEEKMKKIISTAVSALLVLSLAGCSGSSSAGGSAAGKFKAGTYTGMDLLTPSKTPFSNSGGVHPLKVMEVRLLQKRKVRPPIYYILRTTTHYNPSFLPYY